MRFKTQWEYFQVIILSNRTKKFTFSSKCHQVRYLNLFWVQIHVFVTLLTTYLTATCFISLKVCSKRFYRLITQLLFGARPICSSICSRGDILLKCNYGRAFSHWIGLEMHLKRTKVNLLVTARNYVFCASTCDGDLVCATKHFIVTFLETISSSLLC